MASKEEDDDLMVNARLLKTIGLYQLLNPRGPSAFGYNVYKCVGAVYLTVTAALLAESVLNMYYSSSNVNEVTKYGMYTLSTVVAVTEILCMVRNADEIWRCVHSTSVGRMAYTRHDARTLRNGRAGVKSLSAMVMSLWIAITAAWIATPFLVRDYFVPITIDGETCHYRINVLNEIFPVSDTFYNRHFAAYYCAETAGLVLWSHARIAFSVLVTSVCVAISYQLKTIAESFRTFDVAHRPGSKTNNQTEIAEHIESELILDFKVLIQDQQKIIENMKDIYRVIRPVTIIQIATDSITIIILACMSITNYFSGVPLVSLMTFRQLVSLLTYILHIFFICYLFEDNNEQKDSLNFGMYSSGWTENSLYFKKLILYSMRMNSSQDLKLKASQRKIINFELFKNIMQTSYSIPSLLVNYYLNKT